MHAPFLRTLNKLYPGEHDDTKEQRDWGFVISRTTPYNGDGDEARWADFRRRWDQIMDLEMEGCNGIKGIKEAK